MPRKATLKKGTMSHAMKWRKTWFQSVIVWILVVVSIVLSAIVAVLTSSVVGYIEVIAMIVGIVIVLIITRKPATMAWVIIFFDIIFTATSIIYYLGG